MKLVARVLSFEIALQKIEEVSYSSPVCVCLQI